MSHKTYLGAFTDKVKAYIHELEDFRQHNRLQTFQPKFWLQNEDFNVARDVFIAASGSIGHEVTKFSLVYSKTPSEAEAESICRAMDEPCEQLVSAAKVALFCGAGPSLAKEILNDALRLLTCVRDLGLGVLDGRLKDVPQLTGRVWEHSKAQVSKSNCIASKKSMLQCISMLNSTIQELQEAVQEASNETEKDVEDEDDFDFDVDMSEEETKLLESAIKLLSMCAAVLKRGVLTLKNAQNVEDNNTFLKWTAELELAYGEMQDPIVDMGAACTPPPSTDELAAPITSIEAATIKILDALAQHPQRELKDEEQLATGRTALERQVQVVRDHLAAVEQE